MVSSNTSLLRQTIDVAPWYEIDRQGGVFNTVSKRQFQERYAKSGKKIVSLRRFRVTFNIEEDDRVTLHIGQVSTEFDLAALVLCSFDRQPLAGDEVAYVDGDKTNTDISNLRWSTPQERELLLHVMPEGHEDWCTIPSFPRYAVDRSGRFFNKSTGRELQPKSNAAGYVRITLTNVKLKACIRGVHAFMLWSWIGMPPSADHTPDHIDGDKTNNAIENLRWCTPAEQRANQKARVSQCRRRVVRIDADGTRTPFASAAEAGDESGHTEEYVRTAIHQGSKSGGSGYRFMYEEEQEIAGEKWADVDGAPGTHVSSEGRIRFKHGRITRGYELAGYYMTSPAKQMQRVHRLVATAFVENLDPENFDIVHHKNHNKLDNRAENLEWIDTKGNTQAAVEAGATPTKPVFQFDLKTGVFIRRHKSANKARSTGANAAKVRACARGDQKSAGGFLWSYSADAPSCPPEAFASRAKPVFQFDKTTGSFIKEHKSALDAEEDTGTTAGHICEQIAGKVKSAGGFVWSHTTTCPILPTLKVVFQFERHTNVFIEEHKSASEAQEATGVSASSIRACVNGANKSAGKYVWSYTRGGL